MAALAKSVGLCADAAVGSSINSISAESSSRFVSILLGSAGEVSSGLAGAPAVRILSSFSA
eukprot:CAMPEP_0170462846 /NCGR_PEP_ID=MMETSP0123-20130129/8187_1 /TAXON_ID=182087 /ORGANISM="Favella ehrenbergii, Strain Fehren 1" /LENGTH=60 /DNA_ID=CAMNT_0010728145 /DNA_START=747 /DNA_END=926 /DNA_ORIENTATION=+